MIIGNGLLAKSFINVEVDDFLIFASGVSNSLETDGNQFLREEKLLIENLEKYPQKKFIYFSTSSIYDISKKSTLYILHKLKMENLIINKAQTYTIYRVGNVIGNGGNENTLFNFLKNKIVHNSKFDMYLNAMRPIIDIDDIPRFFAYDNKSSENLIIDLSYPYQYSLQELINAIEKHYGIDAIFNEIDTGDKYDFDFSANIRNFFSEIDPTTYLTNIVGKYA